MIYITNNIVHFPRNSKEDVVLLHLVNQLTQSVIDVEVTNTSTNGKIYTFDISAAIAKMVAGQYDYFLYTTDSKLVGSGILQVDNYKTEDVTYNVNYDIIQYSPDEEEVVVPLRKLTIIENGEYDVTNVDEVIVNVNQNDDKIEELEANIEELEALNLGLTNSLNTANSTIEELEGDISNLNQRISYLNEDINGLNDNINQLTTQRNNLQTQVDNLTVENTNLTNSINGLNDKINALNEEKTALQTEIDGLRKQISTLIAERDKLTTENAEYITLINSLNERISTLLGEVDVKNSTISDLENRIASLQSQVDNLTSQNENLSALNAGYVAQIATLNSEISTLQTQVGELQREVVAQRETIDTLNSRINKLITENTEYSESIENLEAQIMSLQNQLFIANESIIALESDIAVKQEEINTLLARIERLEEENAECGAEQENNIRLIEQLQRDIIVKQEEIENLRLTVESKTEELQNAEVEIADKTNQITNLTNQINTLQREVVVLTERVEILEKYLGQTGAQLINRIADLEGQVEDLQTQIEELQRVVVVKQEEIETLNSEITTLNNEIAEKQAYIDTATSISITENGTYTPEEGVVGWNEVRVNVECSGNCDEVIEELNAEITRLTSEVEEKQAFIDTATGVTITTNGTYTPEEGIVGWNEVIVNVEGEIVNTQEKSVEYTENGTYTVVPDDGYYLTGVNVDVNVEGSGGGVTELPIIDNPDNYFYIQSAEDNNIIYFDSSNTRNKYNITSHRSKLEYSYDGTNWTSLNGVSSLPLEKYGDYIFIRNASTTNITPQRGGSGVSTTFSLFGAEYPVKVGGNAQKLLSNYANPTSVSYIYLFANYRATGNYKYDNIAYFDIELPNGTSVSRIFYKDEGIDTLPTIEGLSISSTDTTTSFSNMFYGCYDLTEVPLFDTSNGTNFSYMFKNCKSLTEVPLFDTSNGTNFSYMFSFCKSLTEVPLFDTSNGTNFSCMFDSCTLLTDVPQLDVSNGTNFSNMFRDCTSLTKVPQLDVSNGTNFTQMFKGCTLLNDVTFVGSINSSIDFSECSLLSNDAIKSILTACAATTNTTAKTVSFDNKVLIKEIVGEDVDTLLANCLSKGWTISGLALIEEPAVEESEYFYIKALNPLQPTKVKIYNDTLLYEQKPYYEFSLDAINWFDLEPLKVSEFALDENDKLYLRVKQNIENNNTLPIVVTSDYVLIGGKVISLLSNDNTISNFSYLFSIGTYDINGEYLEYPELRLAYSHCDLSYSNNLSYVLYEAISNTSVHPQTKLFDRLAVVNLNNSDTSNCTNFSYMFYYRGSLKKLIGNLDTSNGTNFSNMFNSCELLTTIPQLDVSNGTNFSNMFSYCKSLTDVTFVGSINYSIDFTYSKSLTYDSIKSILTACSNTTNTTAKTLKFSMTIADTAGELATLVSSCTSKGWTISGLTLE